ncbi:MAG TPA: laccase domain-containing protein [Gemmatimonadales bacterium]
MAASPTSARIPRLELDHWVERYGLTAGMTTAAGGYSVGPGLPEQWAAFRQEFQPAFPATVFGRQVHGRVVRWHDEVPEGWLILDATDGHATAQPGVLLTVSVADCTPVYLADPARGAIGLLHAGWRGAAAGMLAAGVAALVGHGSAISDIVMHCGVAICGSCYEVGSEVAEALGKPPVSGKTHVDIRAVLAAQAAALGVRHVSVSPLCTAHDPGFHSHRASRGSGGRMIAYLGRAP